MSFDKISRLLVGDTPGRSTELNYFRIGPEDAAKKVYLHAALHADEQPGTNREPLHRPSDGNGLTIDTLLVGSPTSLPCCRLLPSGPDMLLRVLQRGLPYRHLQLRFLGLSLHSNSH